MTAREEVEMKAQEERLEHICIQYKILANYNYETAMGVFNKYDVKAINKLKKAYERYYSGVCISTQVLLVK